MIVNISVRFVGIELGPIVEEQIGGVIAHLVRSVSNRTKNVLQKEREEFNELLK